MEATTLGDEKMPKNDVRVLLRVHVYDALAAAKGIKTVVAQAALHGVHRATLFDLRSHKSSASLDLAMRMAEDLGTTVEVLFERVEKRAA
ncbi:MAG TPA: hypothetical protein VFR23_20010 [Jiangellaceae bacterium]|nr:hypothetical protein [Jiangellaceae bacterium]